MTLFMGGKLCLAPIKDDIQVGADFLVIRINTDPY